MNVRKALLVLLFGTWCAWGETTGRADPAVLLKEYTARIVRGNYLLGKRTVRVGEVVTVQAIKGVNAEVTTEQNDHLVVLLADLRTLPEPPPPPPSTPRPVAKSSPVPVPVQSSSGVPADEAAPPVPSPNPIPGVLLTVPAPDKVITSGVELVAERREVKVRCSHLTKKGKQCSRMTASPNGFCWQHGGD